MVVLSALYVISDSIIKWLSLAVLFFSLSVQRVVLCSGKHYYALLKQRETSAANQNTAIIRVEELCPFPLEGLQQELKKYPNAKGKVTSRLLQPSTSQTSNNSLSRCTDFTDAITLTICFQSSCNMSLYLIKTKEEILSCNIILLQTSSSTYTILHIVI